MRVRQEVAMLKICPVTRNNSFTANVDNNCLGSKCMAWRWTGGYADQPDSTGYCGMAGEPE